MSSLTDLKFTLIKGISQAFAPFVRVRDLRSTPSHDMVILAPRSTVRFDASHFHVHGKRPFWMTAGSFTIDANYVVELENAEVIGKGIVVSSTGEVILESTLFQREYLRRSYQNHLIAFRKVLSSSRYGFALPLIYYLDWSYFHWMLEGIGRLALVRDRVADPELKILIADQALPFVRDSIMFFFDLPTERVVSDAHKRKKIDRCLLVSFPHTRNAGTGGADIYPPEIIRWINTTALQRVGADTGKRTNIIITRRNAHQRRIMNEEAIIAHFPSLNFRVVACEELSFREQVDLFSRAGVIIATHGAGLANLLFARDPLVIEFYPNDREEKDSAYFAQITAALGMRHHQLEYAPENAHQDLRLDERWLGEVERIVM